MMTKIIKWNLAFILLYSLSSALVYYISQDTPETILVIILTCLIFNGLITIWILATHINKMPEYSKKQGGGEENEKTEQGSTDETAANPELSGNSDDTNDIY